MSQSTSFICSDCNERIEDQHSPVVVYLVAGLAPMHPTTLKGGQPTDITDHPMPQIIRDLLAKPVARDEYCAECFAKKIGQPLVDAEGKIIQ